MLAEADFSAQIVGVDASAALNAARTDTVSAISFRKRALELAQDAARTELLVREGIGAARFEAATGRTVTRATDPAVDFRDPVLGDFDLKGPLLANNGSKIPITPELVDGLAKSVVKEANFSTASKAVVVDTMGMTQDQITKLKEIVSKGLKTENR